MSKGLKGLLIALLAVGSVTAKDFVSPKTDMNVRLCGDNAPFFTTFHRMFADRDDKFIGGSVMLTGIYGRSVRGKAFANNFGANNTDSVTVIANPNAGSGNQTDVIKNLNANQYNVASDLISHQYGASTANSLAGTMTFDPKQTVWGVRLDYYQNLDKLLDGLYLGAFVPVLHYKNDLNPRMSGEANIIDTEDVRLIDIVTGKAITRSNAAYAQDALKYNKICSNSKTALGDIEAYVGWNFLETKKHHAGINAGVVIPTASEGDEAYYWKARTGESKWGLRLAADASATLWEEKDQNLKILGNVLYKYLFSGTEKRTLGLKDLKYDQYASGGNFVETMRDPIWSQYYLVGTKGSAGLQPLANVSTLDVKVKGRSMLEGQLAFSYANGGFSVDCGYNLLWKEKEDLDLKATCTTWDDQYAVANKAYDSSAIFGDANTLAGTSAGYLKTTDLNLETASANSQLTHKVFAGIGYIAKTWDYPVAVGLGAAYEIPSSKKDTLAGYNLYAKVGISF